MRDLSRVLRPDSVAVIGGGAWCRSVMEQIERAGFSGPVWHVHPRNGAYARIEDLPGAPDAAFVGINRDATIEAVQSLNDAGAGGAVCFASGFAEVGDGAERNASLLQAAGDMPIIGPNCYGIINALDGALLWPDQHGCRMVDRGVAILTQSSNMAINLTMQKRGLPIGYVVTCGNQAQTSQARIAMALLDDARVTAIGLHVEGFGDVREWQALARKAKMRHVPLVVLKVGQSEAAQAAAVSHTASLSGSDTGARALLDHLGIGQVDDLSTFLEALKLLHIAGPLPSARIASISCSGGEASLAADTGARFGLEFPPLTRRQTDRLAQVLGPRVTLANPLDYHTYIWRDVSAMTDAFSFMVEPDLALTLLIVDFPRTDICNDTDWDSAVAAALAARAQTGGRVAMVSTLPELMPEDRARELAAGGVIPLAGLTEAMGAIRAAIMRPMADADLPLPGPAHPADLIEEDAAKRVLADHGATVPWGCRGALEEVLDQARDQPGPFVLKSTGIAHKTEAGAVMLNLEDADDIRDAANRMPDGDLLLERMVTDGVAELLIGVLRDPAHGFVLTLGAGGVLTEIMQDTAHLLVPASRNRVRQALQSLRIAPLLSGYRGKPAAKLEAVLDAIMAIQDYVLANTAHLQEVEINPLICTPSQAVVADALIRRTQ